MATEIRSRRGRCLRDVALLAVLFFGALASCGSSSHPPATGDGFDGGGFDGAPTDASTRDGPPVTPSDSAGGEGGALADGGTADGVAVVQPECTQGTWTTTTSVPSIPTAGFHRFGAVAAPETTLAWTEAGGAIFVADRPSVTAPFGTPVAIDTTSNPVADGRVALMPNGLELIATRSDRTSLTSFVRASVGSAWAPSTAVDEFKFIAAALSESGGEVSEPVVSADGLSLFYLLVTGAGPPALTESRWNPGDKAWDTGAALPNPEFAITSATQRRRPTGGSSDRRTLFFFDEVAGHERIAWRASPTAPFDFFDDLPIAPEAAPAEGCQTLYFQSGDPDAGTGGVSIAQ
jgi:hypothetical protein